MKKRVLALVTALVLLVAFIQPALAANKVKSAAMRLSLTEGTVTVTNKNGKSLTVTEDMKLYNGYIIVTSAKSYAYITIDDNKAIKLDAGTKAEIRTSGKKLELRLVKGSLFCDVKVPLKKDESLNISTSTTITGIRGTSLSIANDGSGETKVQVYSGQVVTAVYNALGQVAQELGVSAGEKLSVVESPDGTITQNTEPLTMDDVPGFIAVLLEDNPELKEIMDNIGIDTETLIEKAVEILQKEQEANGDKDVQDPEQPAPTPEPTPEPTPVYTPEPTPDAPPTGGDNPPAGNDWESIDINLDNFDKNTLQATLNSVIYGITLYSSASSDDTEARTLDLNTLTVPAGKEFYIRGISVEIASLENNGGIGVYDNGQLLAPSVTGTGAAYSDENGAEVMLEYYVVDGYGEHVTGLYMSDWEFAVNCLQQRTEHTGSLRITLFRDIETDIGLSYAASGDSTDEMFFISGGYVERHTITYTGGGAFAEVTGIQFAMVFCRFIANEGSGGAAFVCDRIYFAGSDVTVGGSYDAAVECDYFSLVSPLGGSTTPVHSTLTVSGEVDAVHLGNYGSIESGSAVYVEDGRVLEMRDTETGSFIIVSPDDSVFVKNGSRVFGDLFSVPGDYLYIGEYPVHVTGLEISSGANEAGYHSVKLLTDEYVYNLSDHSNSFAGLQAILQAIIDDDPEYSGYSEILVKGDGTKVPLDAALTVPAGKTLMLDNVFLDTTEKGFAIEYSGTLRLQDSILLFNANGVVTLKPMYSDGEIIFGNSIAVALDTDYNGSVMASIRAGNSNNVDIGIRTGDTGEGEYIYGSWDRAVDYFEAGNYTGYISINSPSDELTADSGITVPADMSFGGTIYYNGSGPLFKSSGSGILTINKPYDSDNPFIFVKDDNIPLETLFEGFSAIDFYGYPVTGIEFVPYGDDGYYQVTFTAGTD